MSSSNSGDRRRRGGSVAGGNGGGGMRGQGYAGSGDRGRGRGRGGGRGRGNTPNIDRNSTPRVVCHFYWSTGACDRGFDCKYKHEARVQTSSSVTQSTDYTPDFFSLEGPSPSPAPPSQPPVPVAPSQPAPAPAPAVPANLAAPNPEWGPVVAQESRGTSEVPAASSSSPGSGTRTPVSHHAPGARPQQQSREPHPMYVAATNVSNALCFVKGVQENVHEAALRNTLVSRFGPVKDLDLVRKKACAFLEFSNVDAARRAIVASLPVSQGGEGGIRIDVGDGQQVRITVERRKARGERPVSRPRGVLP